VIWDYGDDDVIVGIASLVMLMVLPLVVLGRRFLKADEVLPGFALMFILALAGRAIGSQQMMRQVGLGATVWTLVLGMFLSNVVARYTSIKVIEPAAKLAEFFIKIGLVLLAIELSSLGQYGVAGLLVAWCVTPVCVAVIYCVGTRFIAPDCSRSLVCLLAAGISVCGGSAITATASAIKAPPEEQALAISLVSFFTIFYMLALPYIALALGINLSVASAWIGGSVNNTGNVVASVAILDAAAQRIDGGSCPGPGCPSEMGPVIKMAQNAVLGVVTVVISIYWMTYEEEDDEGGASATDIEMGVSDKVLKARGLAQSDAVAAVAAATAAAEQGAESPEQGAGRQEPGVGAGSPAGDVSGEGGKDAEVTREASGKIELQLVGGDGGGASAAEGAGEVAEAVAVGSAADAALVAGVGAAPADPHAAPAEPDVVGAAVASTRDAGGDPAGGQGERGDGERGKVASGAKRQWPGGWAGWGGGRVCRRGWGGERVCRREESLDQSLEESLGESLVAGAARTLTFQSSIRNSKPQVLIPQPSALHTPPLSNNPTHARWRERSVLAG